MQGNDSEGWIRLKRLRQAARSDMVWGSEGRVRLREVTGSVVSDCEK